MARDTLRERVAAPVVAVARPGQARMPTCLKTRTTRMRAARLGAQTRKQ
jgi:hypothetical protein